MPIVPMEGRRPGAARLIREDVLALVCCVPTDMRFGAPPREARLFMPACETGPSVVRRDLTRKGQQGIANTPREIKDHDDNTQRPRSRTTHIGETEVGVELVVVVVRPTVRK